MQKNKGEDVMEKICNDIIYVGVNDRNIDLFESQYVVENGMCYNSYLILDDKIAVCDSVEASFANEWLKNIESVLKGKKPTYLIVHHTEPDHSGSIFKFLEKYPDAKIVSSALSLNLLKQFFNHDFSKNFIIVKDNDTLSLGKHTLRFFTASMVHWPEVIFSYDEKEKVLFSADAFGKFGARDTNEEWDCEARRYYFGIVGKYGVQVQSILKKVSTLDIKIICSLHGPVLKDDLSHYLKQYNTWSSYQAEDEGVCICYTSVYGHTKEAVLLLEKLLLENGCKKVTLFDLSRCDRAEAVEDAFRYSKLVLATTTYSNSIFPAMKSFIDVLVEHNYQNRKVALIENGSWAPQAVRIMKEMLSSCSNLTLVEPGVTIKSALNDESKLKVEELSKALIL